VGPSAKPLELSRPFPCDSKNHLQHAAEIAPNLSVGEAEHLITHTAQIIIPIRIRCLVMRVAIYLNDQRAISTGEVTD